MLNVLTVLQRMDLPVLSSSAIPAVRALVELSPTPLATAAKLVDDLIGIQCTFDDPRRARLTVCAIVDNAIKSGGEVVDPISFYETAAVRVETYLNDPKNSWMFVEVDLDKDETMSIPPDGLTTQVVRKANGKIKKGGKQLLADALYHQHVLESTVPITNQDFIKILMKELDMSKPGATTYVYDLKKKHGAGVLILAKKGGVKSS